MMPGVMSQIPAGNGMQLLRVYDGLVCVVPPLSPVLAETPDEALTIVAVFLGMRKPRTFDDEQGGRRSYQWAAPKVLCPPGSQLMVAKVERGTAQGSAFLLTVFVSGAQQPMQVTTWNEMGVLVHVNNWLSSLPVHPQPHLHAIRIEGTLDIEDDDVFIARIARTAMLSVEDGAPNANAPWTLLCDEPMMRIGLTSKPIVEHIAETLAGATEGMYAVRYRNAVLDIGQRIHPDEPPTE